MPDRNIVNDNVTDKAPPSPVPPAPTQSAQTGSGLAGAGGQLRLLAPDHYYALRYLPDASAQLITGLYAFLLEIQRIPGAVSNAPLGEIRLQWWREALAEALAFASAKATQNAQLPVLRAHPVVEDLAHGLAWFFESAELSIAQQTSTPQHAAMNWAEEIEKTLTSLINHRSRLLYDTPFQTPLDAYGWLQDGDGAVASLCARLVFAAHDKTGQIDERVLPLISAGEALCALARHRGTAIPGLKISGDDAILAAVLKEQYDQWRRDVRACSLGASSSLSLPFMLAGTMIPVYLRNEAGTRASGLSRHWRFMKTFLSGKI